MGLFDELIDTVVDLPGNVIKNTVATVIRVPEVGIKAVDGAIKGVEEGIRAVEKSLDRHS